MFSVRSVRNFFSSERAASASREEYPPEKERVWSIWNFAFLFAGEFSKNSDGSGGNGSGAVGTGFPQAHAQKSRYEREKAVFKIRGDGHSRGGGSGLPDGSAIRLARTGTRPCDGQIA